MNLTHINDPAVREAMRLAGLKPAVVWIHICGAKQPKWWRYSDGIPEIVLAGGAKLALRHPWRSR